MDRPGIASLLLIIGLSLPPLTWGDADPLRSTEPLYGPVELSEDDDSPMAEHLRQAVELRTQLQAAFPTGPDGTKTTTDDDRPTLKRRPDSQ